jgi:hypothetical protein
VGARSWSRAGWRRTSQLRSELERWPGPIGLFHDLDGLISLAFLERYPSPIDAGALGVQRLRAFLERERYRGHNAPSELIRVNNVLHVPYVPLLPELTLVASVPAMSRLGMTPAGWLASGSTIILPH